MQMQVQVQLQVQAHPFVSSGTTTGVHHTHPCSSTTRSSIPSPSVCADRPLEATPPALPSSHSICPSATYRPPALQAVIHVGNAEESIELAQLLSAYVLAARVCQVSTPHTSLSHHSSQMDLLMDHRSKERGNAGETTATGMSIQLSVR
jgi:hypothetical protein